MLLTSVGLHLIHLSLLHEYAAEVPSSCKLCRTAGPPGRLPSTLPDAQSFDCLCFDLRDHVNGLCDKRNSTAV